MQRVSHYSRMLEWPIFEVLWIAEMMVSKSALPDDSVISICLRIIKSWIFLLRVSGISASFELIRHCQAFIEHYVSFQMHLRR
jgi:hypothetical protein